MTNGMTMGSSGGVGAASDLTPGDLTVTLSADSPWANPEHNLLRPQLWSKTQPTLCHPDRIFLVKGSMSAVSFRKKHVVVWEFQDFPNAMPWVPDFPVLWGNTSHSGTKLDNGQGLQLQKFPAGHGFSLGPTQRTPVFGPRDCFASPIGKATSKNPRGDTREPWKIAFWKATTEILQIRYQGTSGDVDESAQSWWVKGRVDRAQPDMHQNVKRSEAMRTEHGNCLQQEQRL